MTYLSDEENADFKGDGSKNAKGEDLATFLNSYNPKDYDNPCNTVDTAVFGYEEIPSEGNTLQVGLRIKNILLVKRKNHPSIGEWAIPGGFVEYREDLDDAARRELEEETNISGILPVQIATYGDPKRDPRARLITTLYGALVPAARLNPKAGDDASEAELFEIEVELINEEVLNSGRKIDTYSLKLMCEKTGDELYGEVEKITESDGLINTCRYEKIFSKGIAVDHSKLILNAFLFIKGLLVN